jgi:hypothetical protein
MGWGVVNDEMEAAWKEAVVTLKVTAPVII